MSTSSLTVDIGPGIKVFYSCPDPNCPYGKHMYRKERTDFNLASIVGALPKEAEEDRELTVDDIDMLMNAIEFARKTLVK
jgi:hypothetical protein